MGTKVFPISCAVCCSAAYEDGFGAGYVPARVAAGLWAGIVAVGFLKCFASRASVSSSPINP
jgi:hypothetical protein